MIRALMFDLDGVLFDGKDIHWIALNEAIEDCAGPQYIISYHEHTTSYDGLKTKDKLKKLTEEKGLDSSLHGPIFSQKQQLTLQHIDKIQPNERLQKLLAELKKKYSIVCCSNSVRDTVYNVLYNLGIVKYFDNYYSNEDIKHAKPNPSIYWKAMINLGVLPEETLIIEDSPTGLLAAERSGCHILRVDNSNDLTLETIMKRINEIEGNPLKSFIPRWDDDKLNILIPMAGEGSRFATAGYVFPKPLIHVRQKTMIQTVVENLNINANFIFLVRTEHMDKYNLLTYLNLVSPGCTVIPVDGLTEGAACTTLLAEKFIDNDSKLLIANSDQFIEWNSNDFMYKMNSRNVDGAILTFKDIHPKWSFSKVDPNTGYITEVAEKNPISDNANVGIYFWKHGSDYVKYAKQMIDKGIRVNGEFYVCPVFNEAIQDEKKIVSYEVDKMWGLGTPEDLRNFLDATQII